MYSSNAQPTGTNRPRACPNHVQNHTRDNTRATYVHPRNQRTHTRSHERVRVHYAVPNQQTRPLHAGGFEEVERVTAAIAKRETPGPIPNPEVKPFSADGTATERLWESRTPPDKHCGSGVTFGWPHFCISGSAAYVPGRHVSTGGRTSASSTALERRLPVVSY